MTGREIVAMAKERFDQELHTSGYAKIHADDYHREQLLMMMEIEPQRHYLDLGTGNGYMAFALARRFSDIFVTGIDITESSIAQNQRIARDNRLHHITFQTYGGMEFSFDENAYHGVVSRYAFHHFPKPELSAREIARILQPGGYFVLADPVAYDEDNPSAHAVTSKSKGDIPRSFIDQFQQMLPDGHVCFYPVTERKRIFQEAGLWLEEEFFTSITYPRPMGDQYARLFEMTPQHVLDRYQIDVCEDTVWITVMVANTKFRKKGAPTFLPAQGRIACSLIHEGGVVKSGAGEDGGGTT